MPSVRLSDFDYALPDELIARHPPAERDGARLLHVPPQGDFLHAQFRDLPALLRAGDLLVLNDARVIKARLRGRKADTGGGIELLLDRPLENGVWLALGNASKGFHPGQRLEVAGVVVTVVSLETQGRLAVDFGGVDALALAEQSGELPLPPYLDRAPDGADAERYQTVFAQAQGAVAAPTAGLHFTPKVLAALAALGIRSGFLTLKVGVGTFLPVRTDEVDAHRMLEERYAIGPALVTAIDEARRAGGRVIAVGTTVTRTLESAIDAEGRVRAGEGLTDLFIRPGSAEQPGVPGSPGHRFRAIDGLLTNFHLPRSTLLMLVSAFAGTARVRAAYAEAIERRYRFFSYGDCCLFL